MHQLNFLFVGQGQTPANTPTTTADRSRSASNGSAAGGQRSASAGKPPSTGPSPTGTEVCSVKLLKKLDTERFLDSLQEKSILSVQFQ